MAETPKKIDDRKQAALAWLQQLTGLDVHTQMWPTLNVEDHDAAKEIRYTGNTKISEAERQEYFDRATLLIAFLNHLDEMDTVRKLLESNGIVEPADLIEAPASPTESV